MTEQTFNVGDIVRRRAGTMTNSGRAALEPFEVLSIDSDTAIIGTIPEGTTFTGYHLIDMLELVQAAGKVPGVFNVGDRVQRKAGTGDNGQYSPGDVFVVSRLDLNPGEGLTQVVFDDHANGHFLHNIEHAPIERLADWELALLHPTEVVEVVERVEGVHGYAVGDVVRQIREFERDSDNPHVRDNTPWTVARLDIDGWPVDPYGDYHHPTAVEIVTKFGETPEVAEPDAPRPFQIGDVVNNGSLTHTVRSISGTTLTHDDGCMDDVSRVTLVTAAPVAEAPALSADRAYQVGDIISLTYDDTEGPIVITALRDNGGYAWENKGEDPRFRTGWDHMRSFTLVTAVEDIVRPLQIGDVVRAGSREWTIIEPETEFSTYRTDKNEPAWKLRVTEGSRIDSWDWESNLTLVTPYAGTPLAAPRKLGETPTEGDHIAINDPRIAWIWEDTAAVANDNGWCSEYEVLVKKLSIPGRKQKWSGSIVVAGSFVYYRDIEADDTADAERIFRAQLVTELTK